MLDFEKLRDTEKYPAAVCREYFLFYKDWESVLLS